MPKLTYKTLAAYFGQDRPSQAEVADTLGITQGYLSLIVSGDRQPSLDLAVRISDLTGVPVDTLIKT